MDETIDKKGVELKNRKGLLETIGWTDFFEKEFKKRVGADKAKPLPARVIEVHRNRFIVSDGAEDFFLTAAGKFRKNRDEIYPVTGDWVLHKDKVIREILTRSNLLSRGAAGSNKKIDSTIRKEQPIAANLNKVFIVSGLDQNFNPRRIERYLTLVYNCGLSPVIILTKGDLHEDPSIFAKQLNTVGKTVPTHIVSTNNEDSIEQLRIYLTPNRTIALIGSSGVGKSTLVNRLAGIEVQATSSISQNLGKGRHTTTTRSLIKIPGGGMIIDNPGTREISLWESDNGIDTTFPEIEEIAKSCRFSNCTHTHEPGCMVTKALDSGELQQKRVENYHKMKKELSNTNPRDNRRTKK